MTMAWLIARIFQKLQPNALPHKNQKEDIFEIFKSMTQAAWNKLGISKKNLHIINSINSLIYLILSYIKEQQNHEDIKRKK